MYVVTYTTESGDEGVFGVFREHPEADHLSAIAVEYFPADVVEEDGEKYAYVHFQVHDVEDFSCLPDPIDPIGPA